MKNMEMMIGTFAADMSMNGLTRTNVAFSAVCAVCNKNKNNIK